MFALSGWSPRFINGVFCFGRLARGFVSSVHESVVEPPAIGTRPPPPPLERRFFARPGGVGVGGGLPQRGIFPSPKTCSWKKFVQVSVRCFFLFFFLWGGFRGRGFGCFFASKSIFLGINSPPRTLFLVDCVRRESCLSILFLNL